MSESLSPSAQRVQEALKALGLSLEVVELPQSTRTAVEAAAAVGCGVEQIVKSLVFKGKHSRKPILVVASGPNRVNEKRMAEIVGEPIVKSLVFKGKHSRKPILVVASGPNRVNEKRMAEIVGEPIERADPDFVRAHTGYVIGGVPPVGHVERIETFIDEDLLQYPEIWAAAGSPNAVFRLGPADLERMTGGRVIAVK
ncbi:MAG: YbaK/EbsC family protein [Chloroflexi bacterium]|nr:YbaK/EbsC family protein [Chloroflexota bacterium]